MLCFVCAVCFVRTSCFCCLPSCDVSEVQFVLSLPEPAEGDVIEFLHAATTYLQRQSSWSHCFIWPSIMNVKLVFRRFSSSRPDLKCGLYGCLCLQSAVRFVGVRLFCEYARAHNIESNANPANTPHIAESRHTTNPNNTLTHSDTQTNTTRSHSHNDQCQSGQCKQQSNSKAGPQNSVTN